MKQILLILAVLALTLGRATAQDFEVQVVLPRAQFPVALAFAPDGRLFYTEKENGRVRVVDAEGVLQSDPVISLPTDFNVELGMLGIAIDPHFEENHYIWITHIQPNTVEPPDPIWRLVRFREEGGKGFDPQEMLRVPIVTREQHHVGGNIHFAPDESLFVSIGDMGRPAFSQDVQAMQGKIHRFIVDGDTLLPHPDNPFANSVFAYGFRNPFDFDFDFRSGDIIGGENGPQCDDEINLVFAGGNYGWRPDYPCDDKAPTGPYIYPLTYFTPPQGLTGVLVYEGEMFPEWQGDVFFCGWNEGFLRRMRLNEARDIALSVEILRLPNHTCSTDLATGPDGSIYFINYNSIYRIVRAGH